MQKEAENIFLIERQGEVLEYHEKDYLMVLEN